MKVEYAITLADYQAAQSLHWHQAFARRLVHFLFYDGFPCLAAGLACVGKRVGLGGPETPYGLVFLLGLICASMFLWVTAKGRKAKRSRKDLERRFPPNRRRALFEPADDGVTSAVVDT